jgi:carbonic anhydrase/acetyltransferase-like protein (isoleucine patch superfamily)
MPIILPYKNTYPQIDPTCFVAQNATITGDVHIGAHSSVWFGAVMRGDVNFIRVGCNTNIQDGAVIHVSRSTGGQTIIGNNITIGHQALIHACVIEDDCLIGMQACIMDVAFIKKGSMVGAGSLVPPHKIIPAGELWVGVPAKFVRRLTPADQQHMAENWQEYLNVSGAYKKS